MHSFTLSSFTDVMILMFWILDFHVKCFHYSQTSFKPASMNVKECFTDPVLWSVAVTPGVGGPAGALKHLPLRTNILIIVTVPAS